MLQTNMTQSGVHLAPPVVMPNLSLPPPLILQPHIMQPAVLRPNIQAFVPKQHQQQQQRRYIEHHVKPQPSHHYPTKETHRTGAHAQLSVQSASHPATGAPFARKQTQKSKSSQVLAGKEETSPGVAKSLRRKSTQTAKPLEGPKKNQPLAQPSTSQPDISSRQDSGTQPSSEASDSSANVIEVSANGDEFSQVTLDTSSTSSKEKTPMCLVNELARYNKITHQYRLTSEDGPPHKKRFTVTLNLGEEEYTSEEASIKKAQHSAAADAIVKTKYKHPPLKVNRMPFRTSAQSGSADAGNITPTVELNALAMKRGETTVYQVEVPSAAATDELPAPTNNVTHIHVFRGMPQSYGNSYAPYGRYPPNPMYPYSPVHRFQYDRRYMDVNHRTQQTPPQPHYGRLAYNKLPPHNVLANGSDELYKVNLVVGQRKFVAFGPTLQSARHNAASKALRVLRTLTAEEQNVDTDDPDADIKSPISLIHEIVLKRGYTVEFKVLSEKGPPHMKTFITQCTAGPIVTEGEGNGKKLSKKRAAETMLAELRKLPPLPPSVVSNDCAGTKARPAKRKAHPVKKKARNLIKEHPDDDGEGVNPISRLIHVSQSNKSKDPVYTLINEAGTPRRREFVMEVRAVNETAQGIGSTKKQAKKRAAENLMIKMGITINKKEAHTQTQNTSTEAASKTNSVASGRQGPSVILLQTKNKPAESSKPSASSTPTTPSLTTVDNKPKVAPETTDSKMTPASENGPATANVRSKDQLIYLANLLDFEMQISDFPKGNHSELLTLITLATVPPILCHGRGSSWDASRDQAAFHVLNMLTELGLDRVSSDKKEVANNATTTVSENALKESIRPKEQLLYLQKLLDFNMQISDFPKGNHSEFLTLIAVATIPPILYHGRGSTSEESGDQAAIAVLQMLTEWGLDSLGTTAESTAGTPEPVKIETKSEEEKEKKK